MAGTSHCSMPKEDRRLKILQLLDETNVAVPPKAVHVNLKLRGGTFSEITTKRLLYELQDEGLVETLSEPDYYYRITQDGRKYLDAGRGVND